MKFQKSSAYTLIEILVVVALITLLFTAGYANYRDFGRRQALSGAAKQLEGDLRKAQQNALSGIKPGGSACDSLALTSYLVDIDCTDSNSCSYTIDANCSGSIVNLDTKSLTGVTVSATSDPEPITFEVLGRGATPSVITITQDGTGKTVNLNVGSGGDISM